MRHTSRFNFVEPVRWLAAAALLIGLIASIHGCSTRYSSDTKATTTPANTASLPEGARRVEAVYGGMATVRAMDDPENPYRDEYKPWDYWFFEHLLAEIPEEKLWIDMTDEEKAEYEARRLAGMGWSCMNYLVDPDGFLFPLESSIHQHERAISNNTQEIRNYSGNWVRAQGEIDPELHAAMWRASDAVSAGYYPAIPDWLAANPPIEAMVMPNGDVVTHGLLGEAEKGDQSGCCGGNGMAVARYDSGGNLVRALKGGPWFYLYYDADIQDEPEGVLSSSRDGYISFRDLQTGSLLSVWDWDGTQLPASDPGWRDPHQFTWLNSVRLKKLHDAVRVG